MRYLNVTVAALVLVASSVGAAVSSLVSLVGTASSFGVVYAAPPTEATFMFFVGESVELEVKILNTAANAQELRCSGATPGQNLAINLTRGSEAINAPVVVSPLTDSITSDARVRLHTLPGAIDLARAEHMRWRLAVNTDALSPGIYAVDVLTTCLDRDGNQVRPRARTFDFELRAPTPESQAEQVRREGYRHLAEQRWNDAEAAATRLLRLNNRSYAAHQLLGDIAWARRDRNRSRQELDAAANILANGQDPQFLRFNNQEKGRDIANQLRARGRMN
jgi:hypothetical protein